MSEAAIEAECLLKMLLHTWSILKEKQVYAPGRSILSVEISNEVRQRVGQEGFQLVKKHYLAYLHFLENFPEIFKVRLLARGSTGEM